MKRARNESRVSLRGVRRVFEHRETLLHCRLRSATLGYAGLRWATSYNFFFCLGLISVFVSVDKMPRQESAAKLHLEKSYLYLHCFCLLACIRRLFTGGLIPCLLFHRCFQYSFHQKYDGFPRDKMGCLLRSSYAHTNAALSPPSSPPYRHASSSH